MIVVRTTTNMMDDDESRRKSDIISLSLCHADKEMDSMLLGNRDVCIDESKFHISYGR